MNAVTAEAPLDLSQLWRRLRYPVVLVVVGLALVTLLAAIGKQSNTAPLDPRSTSPSGAHALAVLLTERGVRVAVVSSLSDVDRQGGAIVLLSAPDAVATSALRAVADSAATVIAIDPGAAALHALGVPARLDARTPTTAVAPGCSLPAALTAGSIQATGDLYAVAGPAVRCYRQDGDAALLQVRRRNGAATIVLGSGSTLSNAALAKEGDAALALGLLNRGSVQWVPGGLGTGPVAADRRGLIHLLPDRLLWATLQIFVALLVLALWRSRRLGRPVSEPLPVVVRAAETVEGRARLMQSAGARDAAAAALRAATIRRLSRQLRLAAEEPTAVVADAVAARTGLPAASIDRVLYGDVPPDDAALVRLAEELTRLEAEARQGSSITGGGR